jgi:hypothetical protein
MDTALIQLVWQRADHRCEYCQLPQAASVLTFQIDHIIALKHHGQTLENNLALTCAYCNSFKGPNIAGLDPDTGKLAALFHPRRDRWDRHFRWNGALLIGRTPVGRVTVAVLEINLPERVEHRQSLIEEGGFPPAPPQRRRTK